VTSPGPSDPTFQVRFTAAGRRSLNALPPSVLSAVIEFAFGELARQPWRVGKPLRGELAGNFSARRGPTDCCIGSSGTLCSLCASTIAGTFTATLSRLDSRPTPAPKTHRDERLLRSHVFRTAPAFDRYIVAPVACALTAVVLR